MGKQKKTREEPTQTPFRAPRNPHRVTETLTRDPSDGKRASNRLRYGTALCAITEIERIQLCVVNIAIA